MRPSIPPCAVVHRDARAPHFLPARNIDCMQNIAITARAQHYTVRAAPAQCTCIPACALRERSGTQEVEVLRCFRAQCLPSLSKSLTSVRWSKETSRKKYQFRPASPAQANNRARRTHLSRIPIQPDLSAWLRSRPKVASARPKLASIYRARLRRAACAAAAGLLQARREHHDRAAAPRRLPARLRRAGCSRPLLSR
jgi:hypothetical protein